MTMSDKDREKWDEKVREMQIAYQMRMGGHNKRLNNTLKDLYVAGGRKDDSMFPRTITGIITMLNTTKDYAKFKDGRREDRNDSRQNSSDNQQENITNGNEEENEEVDEVSGGHTYTP